MFANLQSRFSRAPRWLQIAAVVVAGVVSFWLSFRVGVQGRDANLDASNADVQPAKLVANAPTSTSSSPAVEETPGKPATPSRLQAGILQNPFAPLNLQASMDKPVVVAVVEPKPEKKPMAPPKPPPPPPPVVIPEVIAAPTAPPLPFVVLGAIRGQGIAQGKPVVFLNEHGVSLVVSEGDDIHGTYKVEAISANTIEFTYLPLGQRQSLPLSK